MKQGRSFGRFAPVALLAAIAFFGAQTPARAYDDKSTISAALELLGVNLDDKPGSFDYRERPKLVLPPNRAALPEPGASTRAANWPVDAPPVTHRGVAVARTNGAAPPAEEKPQGLFDRFLGKADTSAAPGTEDHPGLLQRTLTGSNQDTKGNTTEPPRRLLTDPPTGYRQPTKDLATVRDSDGKKSGGWLGFLNFGGGDNDKDPVARTANTASNHTEPEGAISSFGKMMPRFLRGSDKD